jgi:uncharacterized protein YuzE
MNLDIRCWMRRDCLQNKQDRKVLEARMKTIYDPKVDVLRIVFSNAPIEESDEEKLGIILDFNKSGNVVGMEVLDASQRMENPRAVEYAVAG